MESTFYSLFISSGFLLIFVIWILQNFVFSRIKTFGLFVVIPILALMYLLLLQMFVQNCIIPLPCSVEVGAMFLVTFNPKYFVVIFSGAIFNPSV